MKKLVFLILIIFIVSGCANYYSALNTTYKLPVKYMQFGDKFFIFYQKNKAFTIKNATQINTCKDGIWIKPRDRCALLNIKKRSYKLCLKGIPAIYPHIKVLKVDSYAVDLRILSLFSRIYLLVWEKGKVPSPLQLKKVLLGKVELKDLVLGKSYFISGVINFGKNLYGPLSPPILVKILDNTPPLPPSGGGYLIEGKKIILVWNPSPSRDVAYYLVERGNKNFKTKNCSFEESLNREKVTYEIIAVDYAGNQSLPLKIEVNLKIKESQKD